MGNFLGIGISGTASYSPEKTIYAKEMKDKYDFSDEYLNKIGIEKIHVSAEEEYPTDMAIKVSKQAIMNAGLKPKDIDVIIYSYGGFPEYFLWAEYAKVQHEVGACNAVAVRYDQACNAQIIALEYALSKIKANSYINNILIVSADVFKEPIVDRWKTADACFWGDGASAAVVSRGVTEHEVIGIMNMTDGQLNHLWRIPVGGTMKPLKPEYIDQGLFKIDLNRFALQYLKDDAERERVSQRIVNTNIQTFQKLLKKIDKQKEDISKLVTYNIGKHITENICSLISTGISNTSWEFGSQYGHMGPADIFFNYDKMKENGRIRKGDLVVLFSAGTGFSTASAAIQF
ncbi:3-oxoacyl-ACP synthase III family protein [Lutispora sp.]|uniref:3-oxoacyl-ACP synthase III family protein n=1 Tax=Lutispora sp. TaxID=2828727 RepID=UPI002B21EF6F|nr:3-oxoacyl-[acyl-carrier-protein] synthase III C-terminal domain-containing protein [Lutispora sp.]MEA4962242.1 3-oxoacyl-[acyl-carrier-protein] synthase III C-terminal domain-containing protein [Lutispora sp.]